ncbi:MAG: trigger factor [Deltaproteobacteria bacterium]|nr:trigger factor [Deltaproteobacteria bacterium]
MKTTVESPDALHKTIKVELPWEMIKDELDRSYKELAGQVSIKGFRKGKVPNSVIRQRYSKKVEDEVLARMITDSYEAALIQNRIQAVSRPELDRGGFKEGQPYCYTARVEITPEIEIKQINFPIEKAKVEVKDEQVDQEIEKLRDSKAMLIPIDDHDTAKLGDTAIIDYTTTQDDKPVKGGDMTNHPVLLGSGKSLPGFEDHIKGMKVGSHKEFDLEFPKDWGPPTLAGKQVHFKVSLQALKKRELPELDDEFVKDLGKPDCNSVANLKALIKQELLDHELAKADQQTKDELIDKLIEANPFPVPPTLIDRQQENLTQEMEVYLSQQGINLEQAGLNRSKMKKDMHERAEREVKTALLLSTIGNGEKIEVSDSDLEEHLKVLAEKTATNIARIKSIYDQPQAREGLRSKLRQEKVLDYLLDPSNMKAEEKPEDSPVSKQADAKTAKKPGDQPVGEKK